MKGTFETAEWEEARKSIFWCRDMKGMRMVVPWN